MEYAKRREKLTAVKAPLAGCAACVAALALLALLVYEVDTVQSFDAHLLSRALDHPLGLHEPTLAFVASLADPIPMLAMLALACGVALWRGRPLDALGALVIVVGANLTTLALNAALAHPRFQQVLAPHQLAADSFPSGHETAAASIAVAFVLVSPPRLRPLVASLGMIFAIAVGCSIVMLDRHFPSDVVASVLIALAWGLAALAGIRAVDPGSGT
jgi:membrane-associated phospholipid phosphatase